MSRKIAFTITTTIIIALLTGPAVQLAEENLTPCDFVERFNIGHRPTVIDKDDIRWIDALSGFGGATVEALKDSVPIRTVSELCNVNHIGKKKSFLLRMFYNLKGDETCETVPDHIVINEFDPSPAKGESEYVELYNPTGHEINIEGWILDTFGQGTKIIGENIVIKASSYHVVPLDQGDLKNKGELVSLYNDEGQMVDYTLKTQAEIDPDISWQRCPNGQDTDSKDDWRLREATRKAPNNC